MFKKIFKKESKSEEKESKSKSFVSFVLLNEDRLDFDKFKNDLKNDWDLDIQDDLEYSNEEKDYMRVYTIEDMMVAISLMPAPIPNQEAEYHARTNHLWKEAEQVAKDHVAHILISVINHDKPVLDAANLYVKLCSSALKQEHATALDALGSLYEPEKYIELAEIFIKEIKETPIHNLVYFGVYAGSEENTVSLYTYGLEAFNKKEIEIINSTKDAKEVYDFLVDIALYVINYDALLLDNETIGFSEDQKISMKHSKAIALDPNTTTVKIEY